jgi:hypothetical protein
VDQRLKRMGNNGRRATPIPTKLGVEVLDVPIKFQSFQNWFLGILISESDVCDP